MGVGLKRLVSEEKNVSMWPRDCFFCYLVENMAAFCPCLKNLFEAKVKRLRSFEIAKGVYKKSNGFGIQNHAAIHQPKRAA